MSSFGIIKKPASGGGGGGTIGGSIALGQIPVGTAADTIGGSSSLTFTSSFVNVTGGIWCNGATGNTPTSGAGTRMMWIPSKAAFRAGEVTGAQWDAANIGTHSVGFGLDNYVISKYSFCAGAQNTVDAGNFPAFAFGQLNSATYAWCGALGYNNNVQYQSSWAIGQSNTISGTSQASFTAGQLNGTSTSSYAMNLGHSNTIVNSYAGKIFGDTCTVTGSDFGVAIGYFLTLSGATYSVGFNLNNGAVTMTDINTLGIFGGQVLHKQHASFTGSGKYSNTAAITTTDASTAILWSKTLANNTVYYIRLNIVARRTDSGTENGRFSRWFQVYRQGGGGATLGATIAIPVADEKLTMTGTVTIDVSGNDVRARVTGEVGKTFNWDLDVDCSVIS